MFRGDTGNIYSATDLSSHSECEHRSVLELGVLAGQLKRPGQTEISRELLERRGREHERRVLQVLTEEGRRVVPVGTPEAPIRGEAAVEVTEAAMRAGADVIYQGVLRHGQWHGRPDFLLRAPGASRLGAFHYEVADAKLARESKGRAVLQLCVYTDLLTSVQDAAPRSFWIAPGVDPIRLEQLRVDDFMAYFRRVRGQFETFVQEEGRLMPYPEPVEHCDVCPWWKRCEGRRREDDHLSLVAGITRRQRERLVDDGVRTVVALGELPRATAVRGVRDEVLGRIREQARLQVEGRRAGQVRHELLSRSEEIAGLELLPEPSPGDVFLDLEGDAFVAGDGLEYLFGLLELGVVDDYFGGATEATPPKYKAFWATNRADERLAFEAAVDCIVRRRNEFPGMHVYHFGHRENDALKKLASRHATRIDEVDEFLRAGVLVDLHRVTRQGVRASVESYSLKELEPLHGFKRRVSLRDAAAAMQRFGWWLETGESALSDAALRETIERYNEEDCYSTWKLRDWLEARRPEAALKWGQSLRRPLEKEGKAGDEQAKINAETAALVARLLSGLPEGPSSDKPEEHARRLYAQLLGWHQRELKPAYWEYFRARDLPAEDRVEDRAALGELRFIETLPKAKGARSFVHRYEFPPQEHGIRLGKRALDGASEAHAGKVVELGPAHVHLSRAKGEHPLSLIPDKPVRTPEQEASLRRLGSWIAENGVGAEGRFRAARDLLTRHPPRVGAPSREGLARHGEDPAATISRLALALDESTLAIQGPPGSGKTTAAARMIVELVRAGRKVGVTASSHKVIVNLLRKAKEEGEREHVRLRRLHIGDEDDRDPEDGELPLNDDYDEVELSIRSKQVDLVGGTAWAWSRAQFTEALEVLVVDEAGQVSLANALAVAPAAKNLILLGDPAQLEQPQRGVHPAGAEVSALEHLLDDANTMPVNLGVFMPHTRRLHPDICSFTSRVFYDGRLEADPELARQRILGAGPLSGSGLRFVPVEHRGNTNHSDEEAVRIEALVKELFTGTPRFVDSRGRERVLAPRDVLIVAPYNVQVAALRHRLPGYPIGTVDKFQGQQAPIVIYSMTTSSAEDAPRGMEFLFSLNRLNVATSRAQALVVVVASPELARARCRTPRQMRLANALCAYLEMSSLA